MFGSVPSNEKSPILIIFKMAAAAEDEVLIFDAQKLCCEFKVFINGINDENDISAIVEHFSSSQGSDTDKRSCADQAFRESLREKLIVNKDSSLCELLIHLAINCSKKGITSLSLPILLLSDIFDGTTLDICEDLFHIVEKHVSTWTSEPFFTTVKNMLLRMCNDLLRRLSTSQNTIFCGRIQLILTRLFPLSEKSGLNLMSKFNTENVTTYEYKARRIQEKGDLKAVDSKSEIVDFILYNKFWALQDFFRCPTQCYEDLSWKKFVDNASAVLAAFGSHKLEPASKKRKRNESKDVVVSDGSEEPNVYFAKFLTSEKFLNLQLNDSSFRRTILVQLLILFQYLNADVKFKSASQVLKEKQSTFVKESTSKVYELLKETPPDGEKFAKYVECVLTREENWNSWKNAGCPSFIKEREMKKESSEKSAEKSEQITESSDVIASSKLDMGSAELTRLWNLCPDNMAACRSAERMFLPDLKAFFEEAIEQADPDAQIEDQYKLVNDPKFGWRALRLLSRRSQHFFQSSTNPFKTLPEYLDTAVKQLAPEIVPLKTEEIIVINGTTNTATEIKELE